MSKPGAAISIRLRRLQASDAAGFREVRLEGLKAHPEAFLSPWEDEVDKPTSWWVERLERYTVVGGWVGSSPLAGVAGLRVEDRIELRRKGVLWGMYVRPQARGTGLAAALVREVIGHARTRVEELGLTVTASNAAARRLYTAAGFREYGLGRRALKIGSEYHDEVLMSLSLGPHACAAPED